MEQFEEYDKGKLLRDRYIKVSDISEGSYGLVSVAKDVKRSDLLVAVKFIYPVDYKKGYFKDQTKSRPSSSPARLKSPKPGSPNKHDKNTIFNSLLNEAQKEIKIHKILGEHPNISQLYGHFDSCLVLEFCSRGDLYEAIHNGNGPVTTQDIKDVFQQILNAVGYCHSKGVYHRDLKPENILIAEDWSIKLCDWGLATTTKIVSNKDEFDVGSERYMAPELFDNEVESYDASMIDIWSVGVILLTLVFHKNPFQVANYSDKRFLQFASNREALFDIFSTMSGDLFSVLRFCLTIDPTNRDLDSVSKELDALRFFTIDDEFEYEYDYNEGDDEQDEGEDVEEHGSEEADLDDEYLSYRNEDGDKSQSHSGVTESKANEFNDGATSAERSKHIASPLSRYEIPHNHRADALLSTNTKAKPIPINTHDFKFIRNTRKPLTVASFNQNAQMNRGVNSRLGNFNREDYFTPKSVFKHYMDKYGDKKKGNSYQHPNFNTNKNSNVNGNVVGQQRPPQLRRKRTWKTNQRYRPSAQTAHLTNSSRANGKQNAPAREEFPRSFDKLGGKRLSANLSSAFNTMSHPSASNVNTGSSAPSGSLASHLSNSGKYIPPFLRSPNRQPQKSPLVEPLAEEIDDLILGQDDEVFHLEDDFAIEGKENVIPEESDFKHGSTSEGDRSEFSNFNVKNGYLNGTAHINGNGQHFHNGKLDPKGLKPSPPRSFNEGSSLEHANGGKYIPPFRRGSVSRHNPTGTSVATGEHNTGNICIANGAKKSIHYKNRNSMDGFASDGATGGRSYNSMSSGGGGGGSNTGSVPKSVNGFMNSSATVSSHPIHSYMSDSFKVNNRSSNGSSDVKTRTATTTKSSKGVSSSRSDKSSGYDSKSGEEFGRRGSGGNGDNRNGTMEVGSFNELWFGSQKKNWSDYDD
ncbi:KSP2 [Candida theae]|uniref:KSP2 n=1 Tax=Candida theae TaxID=1198502 RepID=A0AAD5BEF8_9ASCO|nr:KSP2 [Candida theae]KAI5958075.1 KSP2 [Candida theae]